MEIIDLFTISSVIAGSTTLLGWWLKSRLESSIKHEYDKVLEGFKSELKRSDLLLSERLTAFKSMSPFLLAIRRYCHAASAEHRAASEFESRTEHLDDSENMSLLSHHDLISRKLDEIELLISPSTRQRFDELFMQMGMGFNLELWLTSDDPAPEIVANAYELYDLVACRVNDVLSSFYNDLGLPQNLTIQSSSPASQAGRR